MAFEVEDVDHAFPDRLTAEFLRHWHDLPELGARAVLESYRLLQLGSANVCHWNRQIATAPAI